MTVVLNYSAKLQHQKQKVKCFLNFFIQKLGFFIRPLRTAKEELVYQTQSRPQKEAAKGGDNILIGIRDRPKYQ